MLFRGFLSFARFWRLGLVCGGRGQQVRIGRRIDLVAILRGDQPKFRHRGVEAIRQQNTATHARHAEDGGVTELDRFRSQLQELAAVDGKPSARGVDVFEAVNHGERLLVLCCWHLLTLLGLKYLPLGETWLKNCLITLCYQVRLV